jgi:hypothetical protein
MRDEGLTGGLLCALVLVLVLFFLFLIHNVNNVPGISFKI